MSGAVTAKVKSNKDREKHLFVEESFGTPFQFTVCLIYARLCVAEHKVSLFLCVWLDEYRHVRGIHFLIIRTISLDVGNCLFWYYRKTCNWAIPAWSINYVHTWYIYVCCVYIYVKDQSIAGSVSFLLSSLCRC
jgi:hypothetical protein